LVAIHDDDDDDDDDDDASVLLLSRLLSGLGNRFLSFAPLLRSPSAASAGDWGKRSGEMETKRE
jgi:hypothetical protein